MLKRQGVALLLAAAVVFVFMTSTLPAIKQRREARAQRAAMERRVEELERRAEALRVLLDTLETDRFVRERYLDLKRLTPEIVGPIEWRAEPAFVERSAAQH